MDRNRYFYELLTEKRSAANKAKNQAEKRAAKEARRVRAGKPTGSKRGKDSYDGRTLSISGKSGEPGTGKGGVEQRKVTGKGYDDEAYSESVNYEDIYLELIGESIYNTYYSMGAVLAEALGLSLNEGLQRDIRKQKGIEKMLARTEPFKNRLDVATQRKYGQYGLLDISNRARRRAERYERRRGELAVGGKDARKQASEIQQHSGKSADETLRDAQEKEKQRNLDATKKFRSSVQGSRYVGDGKGYVYGVSSNRSKSSK